jgi:hypothetical protein
MTSDFPCNRPNCKNILESKNSWALNDEELEKELNDELKDFINSKILENELTVYSMLRSKINSHWFGTVYRKSFYRHPGDPPYRFIDRSRLLSE